MQAVVVVPVDPAEGGDSTSSTVFQAGRPGRAADQFGLVVAVHGLGQGVVEVVADGADRGDGADLSEAFAVTNGGELRPGEAARRGTRPIWASGRLGGRMLAGNST